MQYMKKFGYSLNPRLNLKKNNTLSHTYSFPISLSLNI